MWKKDDAPNEPATKGRESEPQTGGRTRMNQSSQRATIGRSITIEGKVTGDEDLLIEGHVDGTVNLKQHAVTVGSDGEVEADVSARLITIEGKARGNLTAHEQVVLRASADVEGDIEAPRVVLEDGARFRGGIDMGEPSNRDSGRDLRRTSGSASGSPGLSSSASKTPDPKGSDATKDKSEVKA